MLVIDLPPFNMGWSDIVPSDLLALLPAPQDLDRNFSAVARNRTGLGESTRTHGIGPGADCIYLLVRK